MSTAPNPIGMATASSPWLRRSVLSEEQIRAFLQEGALFAWSDNRWVLAWGDASTSPLPDPDRPSFYTPDFSLSSPHPWRSYPHCVAISPDSLAQQILSHKQHREWTSFDESAFARSFYAVEAAIHSKLLQKAVPAVFEYSPSPLDAADREHILRSLINLPAGLIPYGYWDQEHGILGASPELLFESDGSNIHTMAVAGTTRAGVAPSELMHDPKERNEHQFVLDDIKSQLAPLGSISHEDTHLWRIGMISHLRTDIYATASNPIGFADLVDCLHPTPAVGITPRGDWRQWSLQIDSAPRGGFAAPFGLALPDGLSRCLVAIRNVQWDRAEARCGAGCGLVDGSQLSREIHELQLKLSVTRNNLGL